MFLVTIGIILIHFFTPNINIFNLLIIISIIIVNDHLIGSACLTIDNVVIGSIPSISTVLKLD